MITEQKILEFANKVVELNKTWLSQNENPEKLYQHEALKSFCRQIGNGKTEYKKSYRNYRSMRDGRVDYVDETFAVEIDDGHNINAIRKLIVMEEEDGRIPLWIIHHHSQKSKSHIIKSGRMYKIPLLIIDKYGNYDIIFPSDGDKRSTKYIKYKQPPLRTKI